MIRALIIDDVPLFRRGLRWTLEQMDDCHVVGEATQVADILQVTHTQHPDVVLLHESLASTGALDIARLLFQSEQPALFVLADELTEEQLFHYLLVGAAAYEARWISPEELTQKVQRVSAGEYLISGDSLEIPHRGLSDAPCPHSAPVELSTSDEVPPDISACPLSTREAQILVHIAQGMSNKQIARVLSISDQTVKNHIAAVLRTLGVADRTAAVMEAWRQNWMMPDGSESGLKREAGRACDGGTVRPSQRKGLPGQEEASLIQSPPASEVRYHLQKSFCHKMGCHPCHDGTGHGPYWYAYQTIQGRTVRRYVGKALPAGVRAG